MWEKKLDAMEQRWRELEATLSREGDTLSEPYLQAAKEYKKLESCVRQYQELKKIRIQLIHLKDPDFTHDKALVELAVQEERELRTRAEKMEKELEALINSGDPDAERNAIVEIRAGTGGDEAALFAGDLYRMYMKFAQSKGLQVKEVSSHPTGLGGFKEIVLFIEGPMAFKWFKYEQGVHRVQRVPKTEASGRIHTSTITVAVLPEASEVDIQIDPKDLKIDTYRSSGAGGQHVNKTESAVRITHLPTGLVVACQEERSQGQNRAKAFTLLRSRLKARLEERLEQERRDLRRRQVGTGERSEKIRTYNFPQDRVTDHRINQNFHDIENIMGGHLEDIVGALLSAEKQ